MARRRIGHRAIAGGALALASALAVAMAAGACGIFDLGDVVAPVEGGAEDVQGAGDDVTDLVDGAPCDPGDDPCKCLPAPLVISPPPRGTGEQIAVSGGYVYFMVTDTMPGNGSPVVFRAPIDGLDGGTPEQVTVPSTLSPQLSVGGSSLFFRRVSGTISFLYASLEGTNQTPSLYVGPLSLAPGDFTSDQTTLYWTNSTGVVCGAPIQATPPPSGDAGATGCNGPPIVPPRDGGPTNGKIAAGGGDVFITYGSQIYGAPIATGTAVDVVPQPGGSIANLTESNGRIFWTFVGSDAGSARSALHDGGDVLELVPSLLDGRAVQPTLVVDGDGIYWGERVYSKLWMAARDGTNARMIACEPSGIPAIATDTSYVYWLSNDGAVKRTPKNPPKP